MCPQRNVAIIRSLATTAEGNVEPDGTGPTNKQQQRAHRHGEIPRAAEFDKRAWGESAREERRGDIDAQGRARQDLFAWHWGIVQQGAIWRNTTAGQWACIHLQMESSLLVWAWVSRKKRGEAGRGFKCSNLHAWQGRFLLESRSSRGERNPWMRGLRAHRLKCQHR